MAPKTLATGWKGSQWVGIPGQPNTGPPPSPVQQQLQQRVGPAPAAPAVVGSQGKNPAEWRGSTYIGPAPPAPPINPTSPSGPISGPQVQPSQASLAPAGQPRAIEGYDAGKLADPTHQTHKYVGGRILQAGGGVDQVLADPKFAGWTKVGDDKIRSPEGSVYDLGRDFSGSNGQPGANVAQWTYVGGGPAGVRNDGIRGNDPHSANYTKPGGLGYTGGAAGGQTSLTPGMAGGSFQDQTRALLMQQMQGLAAPIDANDPTIAGEMRAQERTLERGRQERRAAAAERMAASGLNSGGAGSGAMDQDIAAGYEDKGAALTGLQAQLFSRELQSRRQSMAQLLSQALQTGDNESARALTMQIQQMDNEIRKRQLAQQGSQFDASFGLQRGEFEYGMDRDASRAKAGLPF